MVAGGPDTLGLLGRADEPFAVAVADARNGTTPNGATRGGPDFELESDDGETVTR